MRILRRYLLREFFLPWVYCLDAFVLLWLVADLIGRLDDFIEANMGFGQAFRYYFVLFPEVLVQILPMSLLLGLLFVLTNLAKHNELLAMRACGVSLARLATPFWALGLTLSVVVLGLNEWFVPDARLRANQLLKEYRGRASANVLENLFFTNLAARRDWYIPRLNLHNAELFAPEIHERRPDGSASRDLYAERAVWNGQHWVLFDVDVYEHPADGSPTRVQRHNLLALPELNESPARLVAENKRPSEMTSRELRRTIRALQRAGHEERAAELRTVLHYRYAFPITCLIVVGLAFPLGVKTNRSGPLVSVGTALALLVTYYLLNEISLKLGIGGRLPAPCAAWLTNASFGIVAGYLFWRVR